MESTRAHRATASRHVPLDTNAARIVARQLRAGGDTDGLAALARRSDLDPVLVAELAECDATDPDVRVELLCRDDLPDTLLAELAADATATVLERVARNAFEDRQHDAIAAQLHGPRGVRGGVLRALVANPLVRGELVGPLAMTRAGTDAHAGDIAAAVTNTTPEHLVAVLAAGADIDSTLRAAGRRFDLRKVAAWAGSDPARVTAIGDVLAAPDGPINAITTISIPLSRGIAPDVIAFTEELLRQIDGGRWDGSPLDDYAPMLRKASDAGATRVIDELEVDSDELVAFAATCDHDDIVRVFRTLINRTVIADYDQVAAAVVTNPACDTEQARAATTWLHASRAGIIATCTRPDIVAAIICGGGDHINADANGDTVPLGVDINDLIAALRDLDEMNLVRWDDVLSRNDLAIDTVAGAAAASYRTGGASGAVISAIDELLEHRAAAWDMFDQLVGDEATADDATIGTLADMARLATRTAS